MKKLRNTLSGKQKGLTIVEFTLAAPVFFLLTFGIIQGGIAVFMYGHVAHLAKEGVRYAVVRGSEAAQDTSRLDVGDVPATEATVINHLKSLSTLADVNYQVTWPDSNSKDPGSKVKVVASMAYIPSVFSFPSIDIEASATGIIHY